MTTALKTLPFTGPAKMDDGLDSSNSRFAQRFKWAARITLVVIGFVWYSPYVKATVEEIERPPIHNQLEHYFPLGQEMTDLRKQLLNTQQELSKFQWAQPDKELAKTVTKIQSDFYNLKTIKNLDDAQRKNMRAEVRHYKEHGVDTVIIARSKGNLANYIEKMDELYEVLRRIETHDKALGVVASSQDFSTWRQVKGQLLEDSVQRLAHPFGRGHESLSNEFGFVLDPPRDIYVNQEQIEDILGLDTGEYLSADSATKITDLIALKVAELGTDPLTLYKWVHDTIRWLPSYGVMQGADYTLQAEQGNSFDTASLLIALFREAGYEARYRYGIVQAPVDEVANWVGNVKNADAATNLMSQGGIPQTQVSFGGAVEEIRFEHVWVEVNQGGQWYSLDPSFKQYDYTDGLDLESAVAFDAEGLITQIQNGSTSNDSEGWVEGVDASVVENALSGYQADIEAYLNSTVPNATLGDVLGLQAIRPSDAASLEGAAPAHMTALQAAVAHLPESMFYRFRFQLGTGISADFGASFAWGGQIFELNEFTPHLLGKDIAISFRPATQSDEEALLSFIPENAENAEDLPTTIPAGSIKMVAELSVDGTVVQSSDPAINPITLGDTLRSRIGYDRPDTGLAIGVSDYAFTENNLVAGQYKAIGIDMQGLSPTQLESLQSKLENTKDEIEADNTSSLTKHDVVGGILQAGIQGYMAMTFATDRIAAQSAGVAYYRQPSYGTFATDVAVGYDIAGVPTQISFTGVAMDVDRVVNNVEEKSNCYEGFVAFNRASGMRNSAYEHQIPEQLFSTDADPVEGVSTAKAFAIAMAQGQRIYTLTASNASELSNITIDDDAREEIQNALAAGLEVAVHTNPITVNGWQGSGYTILDIDYGIGAYKISGGISGGLVDAVDIILLSLTSLFGAFEALSAMSGSVGPAAEILTKVAQFLKIASFIQAVLTSGLDCPGFAAEVSLYLTFVAILSLLTIEIALMISNPIVAFVASTGVDVAFEQLKSATVDCT